MTLLELSLYHSFLRPFFLVIFLTAIITGASQHTRAATLIVPAGGSFQAALDSAQPGDTIVLQAGAIYTGPFTLPNKSGTNFITIQSSALDSLPPAGQRVSPANSALMPKLVSPGLNQAVMSTAANAHHYQFIGIEISPANANVVISDLIKLGDGNQTSLTTVAHHLILDRCYIHGYPTQDVKRGVALNSGDTSIINSYISDIHGVGYDTQAICGWNGPGPYRIINNYLEAAGENVMFGGADPAIANLVPSDIEIRGNSFFKPLTWKVDDPSYAGIHWTVKNLLELKNARRVIIDGNVFENSWPDAQVGFAILLKSTNQSGTCTWCVSEDVTVSNNVIRNVEHGLNVLALDNGALIRLNRLRVINNLWEKVRGIWFQGTDGADNVVLEHNTHVQSGNVMTLYGAPTTGFVCRNNLGIRTGYGIKGDGTGEGTAALAAYGIPYTYNQNVLVAAPASQYPAANFYPTTIATVGFVDPNNGDYRLSSTSPYRNAATDGKDIGVDFIQLTNALGGSIPPPAPTPTPNPSATPTPTPSPSPGASPTPEPSPSPTPTGAGKKLGKAKRTGQAISNQIASGATTSNITITTTNAEYASPLQEFIDEIQQAYDEFRATSYLFTQAGRIDLELARAYTSAVNANVFANTGNTAAVQTQLRAAIDHLALGDVLISAPDAANPIDVPGFMVRQTYLDFLNREPDPSGDDFWTNDIVMCGTDPICTQVKRVNVSAAFFLSIEFQETGYYVYRLYKSTYGRVPTMVEFMPDTVQISRGVIVGSAGWEDRLAANKQQFLSDWTQRAPFQSRYGALTNKQFVDSLVANLGVTIPTSQRNALVTSLNNGTPRAAVLEQLATNDAFTRAQFNSAFVLMEYFGYLRRDPDPAGFNFWLSKLNEFNGNFTNAEMVRAFLESTEYRSRFTY